MNGGLKVGITHVSRKYEQFELAEKLGEGFSRAVYVSALNSKVVVKVAQGLHGISANISEYELWSGIKHTDYRIYLAPVLCISEDGKYLKMARTSPVLASDKKKMPKKIPRFISDTKLPNMGFLHGRVVVHDYGEVFHSDFQIGLKKLKLLRGISQI